MGWDRTGWWLRLGWYCTVLVNYCKSGLVDALTGEMARGLEV